MDTNTVAFNFSPYLLPIVVHEILSNLDFALPILYLLIPITLKRWWGITDDFEIFSFHLVLYLLP